MARTGPVVKRVEGLLGTAVVAASPVAGGDICTATRLRLSSGASALVKTRPRSPADFFRVEARGLRWLAEATPGGGVACTEVLAVADDCLVLAWVEQVRPGVEAAERLGRELAATHAAGAPQLGSTGNRADEDGDGYIGTLPLPNGPAPGWPEFFVTRRVLPYLQLARDRGAVGERDATAVEGVVRRIAELAGPDEPAARLHGDLWSGNLLWGRDASGDRVWLVDPAAHGGHRESDLAMLALFGCPQLQRVLDSYDEAAPLADGWRTRVALHQLFPLLVHACLFGAAYGARAGEAARQLL